MVDNFIPRSKPTRVKQWYLLLHVKEVPSLRAHFFSFVKGENKKIFIKMKSKINT